MNETELRKRIRGASMELSLRLADVAMRVEQLQYEREGAIIVSAEEIMHIVAEEVDR